MTWETPPLRTSTLASGTMPLRNSTGTINLPRKLFSPAPISSPLSTGNWQTMSPYLAPTKESLSYFQGRREAWRMQRREKLSKLDDVPVVASTQANPATPSGTNDDHQFKIIPTTPTPLQKGSSQFATDTEVTQPVTDTPSYDRLTTSGHQYDVQLPSFPNVVLPQTSSIETNNIQTFVVNSTVGDGASNTTQGNSVSSPTSFESSSRICDPDDFANKCDANTNYRERLVAFYQRYNPEKVGDVDETLRKYAGNEEAMFAKLKAKYDSDDYLPATGTGPVCFLELSTGDMVQILLFSDKAPYAAHNFWSLCTGKNATSASYRGCPIHRIVPNFCIQAGDFTAGNGTGGRSIFPPSQGSGPKTDLWGNFEEQSTLLRHDAAGLVSMANHNNVKQNGSQFFITLRPLPHLNGKHVVFGKVITGLNAILALGQRETHSNQQPVHPISIVDCGEVATNGDLQRVSAIALHQGQPVESQLAATSPHDNISIPAINLDSISTVNHTTSPDKMILGVEKPSPIEPASNNIEELVDGPIDKLEPVLNSTIAPSSIAATPSDGIYTITTDDEEKGSMLESIPSTQQADESLISKSESADNQVDDRDVSNDSSVRAQRECLQLSPTEAWSSRLAEQSPALVDIITRDANRSATSSRTSSFVYSDKDSGDESESFTAEDWLPEGDVSAPMELPDIPSDGGDLTAIPRCIDGSKTNPCILYDLVQALPDVPTKKEEISTAMVVSDNEEEITEVKYVLRKTSNEPTSDECEKPSDFAEPDQIELISSTMISHPNKLVFDNEEPHRDLYEYGSTGIPFSNRAVRDEHGVDALQVAACAQSLRQVSLEAQYSEPTDAALPTQPAFDELSFEDPIVVGLSKGNFEAFPTKSSTNSDVGLDASALTWTTRDSKVTIEGNKLSEPELSSDLIHDSGASYEGLTGRQANQDKVAASVTNDVTNNAIPRHIDMMDSLLIPRNQYLENKISVQNQEDPKASVSTTSETVFLSRNMDEEAGNMPEICGTKDGPSADEGPADSSSTISLKRVELTSTSSQNEETKTTSFSQDDLVPVATKVTSGEESSPAGFVEVCDEDSVQEKLPSMESKGQASIPSERPSVNPGPDHGEFVAATTINSQRELPVGSKGEPYNDEFASRDVEAEHGTGAGESNTRGRNLDQVSHEEMTDVSRETEAVVGAEECITSTAVSLNENPPDGMNVTLGCSVVAVGSIPIAALSEQLGTSLPSSNVVSLVDFDTGCRLSDTVFRAVEGIDHKANTSALLQASSVHCEAIQTVSCNRTRLATSARSKLADKSPPNPEKDSNAEGCADCDLQQTKDSGGDDYDSSIESSGLFVDRGTDVIEAVTAMRSRPLSNPNDIKQTIDGGQNKDESLESTMLIGFENSKQANHPMNLLLPEPSDIQQAEIQEAVGSNNDASTEIEYLPFDSSFARVSSDYARNVVFEALASHLSSDKSTNLDSSWSASDGEEGIQRKVDRSYSGLAASSGSPKREEGSPASKWTLRGIDRVTFASVNKQSAKSPSRGDNSMQRYTTQSSISKLGGKDRIDKFLNVFLPLSQKTDEGMQLRTRELKNTGMFGSESINRVILMNWLKEKLQSEYEVEGAELAKLFSPVYPLAFRATNETTSNLISYKEFRVFLAYVCAIAVSYNAFFGIIDEDDDEIDCLAITRSHWLKNWRKASGLGLEGLNSIMKEHMTPQSLNALFEEMDVHRRGIIAIDEWIEFCVQKEIDTSTLLGSLLAKNAGKIDKSIRTTPPASNEFVRSKTANFRRVKDSKLDEAKKAAVNQAINRKNSTPSGSRSSKLRIDSIASRSRIAPVNRDKRTLSSSIRGADDKKKNTVAANQTCQENDTTTEIPSVKSVALSESSVTTQRRSTGRIQVGFDDKIRDGDNSKRMDHADQQMESLKQGETSVEDDSNGSVMKPTMRKYQSVSALESPTAMAVYLSVDPLTVPLLLHVNRNGLSKSAALIVEDCSQWGGVRLPETKRYSVKDHLHDSRNAFHLLNTDQIDTIQLARDPILVSYVNYNQCGDCLTGNRAQTVRELIAQFESLIEKSKLEKLRRGNK